MPSDWPHKAAPDTSETDTRSADEALAKLRRDFTGHRIWRAVRWDGRLGDWVASLHDPHAGVDPTVIRSTAAALREALVNEALRAEAVRAVTW
ncbi:hypothetical protein [Actinomadura madurae]|uniref:hypothetical protein n=1 Tax=Actinomadura madurae TaxID=1993 RepID=UPI0020D24B47|nr:hypothetical protein [Actinomadura madurae]MCP9949071.1 hypothetical protein [Actinomadura madurae]MCP9965834.1 hypothetical protein [Actinomadura madurae]MCP9978313.1 hypothetical protein [Actinomadura madurae]MCQ0010167.1 hypothetical protein [Actinomadura madurae]MCQ0014520.1 hypothetical protein [Actinomadura madurae]